MERKIAVQGLESCINQCIPAGTEITTILLVLSNLTKEYTNLLISELEKVNEDESTI